MHWWCIHLCVCVRVSPRPVSKEQSRLCSDARDGKTILSTVSLFLIYGVHIQFWDMYAWAWTRAPHNSSSAHRQVWYCIRRTLRWKSACIASVIPVCIHIIQNSGLVSILDPESDPRRSSHPRCQIQCAMYKIFNATECVMCSNNSLARVSLSIQGYSQPSMWKHSLDVPASCYFLWDWLDPVQGCENRYLGEVW